jgi:osmoprotectant transport system ATP-binding protein
MIELRGVEKRYGGAAALRKTDLTVEAGRTTALIGPSGCGKSTLLRLIIGLVDADAGEVWIGGARFSTEMRRQMGYVIQDGGLFPHLTARQNVTLLARHQGWSDEKIRARAGELAQLVRLDEALLARYPAQLSGGQRQRVSLMRALFHDPSLVLLDEPLGALDPLIRAELQADLRAIFAGLQKTVLLVTHDLAEAGLLAERIVLLREGAIVQAGTLRDLVERPVDEFVARFVRAQRGPLEVLA